MKRFEKWIGYLLIFAGVFSILLAFVSDFIGFGGQEGFGGKQKTLIGVGILVMVLGIGLVTPTGQRFLLQWKKPEEADSKTLAQQSKKSHIVSVLLLAGWFGLVTGLIEVGYRAFQKFVLGNIIDMTEHFLWMTPLTYLAIFLCVGLVIIIIGLVWSRIMTIGITTFIYLFISIISLYYISPKIHIIAALLLALGVSFQLARFLTSRGTVFYRFVMVSFPWMIICVLSIAAFMIAYIA